MTLANPDIGTGQHEDRRPRPYRRSGFLALAAALLMASFDGAVINVALPAIAADQGVTPAAAIGAITAYQIAVVISLLPLAALAESIGFKRVFFAGVGVFALGAILSAQSGSIPMLSAARAIQGLGAGAIMSINIAMLRHVLPSARLGRGIGIMSLVVGCAGAAGPPLAGGILALLSWHWLFLLSLPLCAVIAVLGAAGLPDMAGTGRRFDVGSALLNACAFGFFIFALGAAGRHDDPALVLAQLAVAAIAFVLLTLRQNGRAAPLLPVDLLASRRFALSILASVCSFVAQYLALVSLPFFLLGIMGRSVAEIGLLLTPWPVALAVLAPLSGRLADRISADYLSTMGMAIFAAGFLCLAALPEQAATIDILWRLALCGIGQGVFLAPSNRTIISSAPKARSGGASGLQSTGRVLGQSVGAALAGLLVGSAGHAQFVLVLSLAAGFAGAGSLASLGRVLLRDGR